MSEVMKKSILLKGYSVFVIIVGLSYLGWGVSCFFIDWVIENMDINYGLPSWVRIFIGLAQIAGGIGLILSRTRILAAVGLLAIMVGALYFHLSHSDGGQGGAISYIIMLIAIIAAEFRIRRMDR